MLGRCHNPNACATLCNICAIACLNSTIILCFVQSTKSNKFVEQILYKTDNSIFSTRNSRVVLALPFLRFSAPQCPLDLLSCYSGWYYSLPFLYFSAIPPLADSCPHLSTFLTTRYANGLFFARFELSTGTQTIIKKGWHPILFIVLYFVPFGFYEIACSFLECSATTFLSKSTSSKTACIWSTLSL